MWNSLNSCCVQFSSPGLPAEMAIYSAAVSFFLYFLFLIVAFETTYFRMYWSDLYQIFRTGRRMGADDRSDLRLPVTQWMLLWQPILGSYWQKCLPHLHSLHCHAKMDWMITTEM